MSDSGDNRTSSSSSSNNPARYRQATACVTVRGSDQHNASCTPIYQTATFKQTSATEMGQFDYTRSGNPTRSALETHLQSIMRCSRAFATTTGMSALDAILRLVGAGDEIIAGDDLYGGEFHILCGFDNASAAAVVGLLSPLCRTNRLLTYISKTLAIKVHHVDTTDEAAVAARLNGDATRIVLLESPTNPLMKIVDIRAVAALVHANCPRALVVVDNTMMSPVLMNCLELGADIEYHSGTKYLSGHHDLMAGIIGVKDAKVAESIYFIINSTGIGLAPFDSYLLLRGIKTLSLRMERQQENAVKIAQFLESAGYAVNYPALASHPQHALHASMAKGGGAVLSFTTGSVEASVRIVEAARLWGISVSFGCVNSLISMPCNMSHASIPAEVRKARALPEDLIRLCVGIEDVNDLIDDLKMALAAGNVHATAASTRVAPVSIVSRL
ncbi:cystathionine beta-lyase [Entophlyctis sp. JEL0112]|nr:cystathionine beta-lyase [Entophlyctis sp. JEL0112]